MPILKLESECPHHKLSNHIIFSHSEMPKIRELKSSEVKTNILKHTKAHAVFFFFAHRRDEL